MTDSNEHTARVIAEELSTADRDYADGYRVIKYLASSGPGHKRLSVDEVADIIRKHLPPPVVVAKSENDLVITLWRRAHGLTVAMPEEELEFWCAEIAAYCVANQPTVAKSDEELLAELDEVGALLSGSHSYRKQVGMIAAYRESIRDATLKEIGGIMGQPAQEMNSVTTTGGRPKCGGEE